MQSVNLTKPRKAILDVVRNSKEHPTAADIIEKLAKTGNQFAYGTIYNSLKYLTDHGLIRELSLRNGVTHYDGRVEDHHHIVCRRCGVIAETTVDVPDSLIRQMEAETGYKIDDVKLQMTGLCPVCNGNAGQS